MRRALILDGASGPALSTTRSLGRAGWEIVAPANTRSAVSKYTTAAFPIPDAAVDPGGFVAAVEDLLLRVKVDVAVPCTDASVALLRANERILRGAKLLGGDRASTRLCLDKADALAAAERAGFPVPAWLVPKTLDEASEALARLGLPAVVKPRRSYFAEGSALVHRRSRFVEDPEELADALAASAEKDSLPVLQAFVPGRSLAVTAVLREGRLLAYAARETFSFIPIGGGTSVWKRTIPPDDVGVQDALELLRGIGYEGLAEVEYQVGADGVPRLMEIGVRVHGWIGLAISAGVNLPVIAAGALLGDRLPDAQPYRVGTEMRWPAGELRRIRMAFGPRTKLPPGVSRAGLLGKAWPPWRAGMRYDGIDFNDLVPWVPKPFRPRRRRSAPSIEGLPPAHSPAAPSIRS
jgi:predicted ATP-grasp superfamily ATP-dependent carboligase